MNLEMLLQQLEREEELLSYSEFQNEDVLTLGTQLARKVQIWDKPVAIRIYRGDIIVFQYSMEGKEEHHYNWIRKKRNLMLKIGHSSMYARLQWQYLHMHEELMENQDDYGFGCGAFPIRVKGKGIIGTVVMSGLPDPADHTIITVTIAEILGVHLPKLQIDEVEWNIKSNDRK